MIPKAGISIIEHLILAITLTYKKNKVTDKGLIVSVTVYSNSYS